MKVIKKILMGLMLICTVLSSAACEAKSNSKGKKMEILNGKDGLYAVLETEKGTIVLNLFYKETPMTVTNFVGLAEGTLDAAKGKPFYDGLKFHRVISNFMIQGGDPKGNGTGGSDETIKGEFSQNGVKNEISHVRGTISMARSQAMDSASSQFFIVQTDSTYLDGQYAGFGTVTKGMDIVDEICKDVPVEDNNGTVKSENQPVIESIKVIK